MRCTSPAESRPQAGPTAVLRPPTPADALHSSRPHLHRPQIALNSLQAPAFGFAHQYPGEAVGGDCEDRVKEEGSRTTQDVDELQERHGHDQIEAPIGDGGDAHSATTNV